MRRRPTDTDSTCAQYALGKRLALGIAARNLSASLNWKVRLTNGQSSSTEDLLPRVLSAGIAYRPFAQGTLGIEVTKAMKPRRTWAANGR